MTKEMDIILMDACELYRKASDSKDLGTSLELYNEALKMLVEHGDETADMYYNIVLANCIEEMQRKGDIKFSEAYIQFKVAIYSKMFDWFLKEPQYKNFFEGHLCRGFDALGRLCLLGEEGVNQSDQYAYICYMCIKSLSPLMAMYADVYLEDFVKDETTGEVKFIGVRPR